jgi:uncharacterized membrane protein
MNFVVTGTSYILEPIYGKNLNYLASYETGKEE